MKNEQEVYKALFRTVEQNLTEAGDGFHYKESTFLSDVNANPTTIDVSRYVGLPNECFFQAVFVAAYKRLPEEKELTGWIPLYGLEQETFQTRVLKKMVRSSTVAINHIHFRNIPYFRYKEGIIYKAMGSMYRLTDKSSLREFGKKLPMPVQKLIRKIFI